MVADAESGVDLRKLSRYAEIGAVTLDARPGNQET